MDGAAVCIQHSITFTNCLVAGGRNAEPLTEMEKPWPLPVYILPVTLRRLLHVSQSGELACRAREVGGCSVCLDAMF